MARENISCIEISPEGGADVCMQVQHGSLLWANFKELLL